MIDLLLLNPSEQAIPLARALSANNVSYQIVITNGQMFGYPADLNVLNLNTNPWDKAQQYKSGIAWTPGSQRWLDSISDQVVLHNKPLVDRKEYYMVNKFDVELGKMFNILSYKGKHVIVDAFVYKDTKWSVIKDQSLPFFTNGVDDAFTFLDTVGILNGPSRVFIEPNGKVSVRLVPKSIGPTAISTRNFLDIWPYILTLEDTEADLAFSNWVERTGPAKQFQLVSGL